MRNPLDYTMAEIETLIRIGLLEGCDYHFLALMHEVKEYQRDAECYQVKKDQQAVIERERPAPREPRPPRPPRDLYDYNVPCVLVSE